MSLNAYSEIYIHVTWRTKNNGPMIVDDVKANLYQFLLERAHRQRGVVLHAIGGTEDHIHIAASIPPTLMISAWVGDLKGSSSHFVNQRILNRAGALEWQAGYGVVSFGAKDLAWVSEYIQYQPQRHRDRKIAERLERFEGQLAANRGGA